ncbi:MAG: hypothetical protein ACRYHA_29450 [Janthinobacterium lividum]
MHWIDPAHLPATKGKVSQFLLNPHGELDGLVLDGRLQVHFPPHLSKQVGQHIATGERVEVRGVRPRDAEVVAAVSLKNAEGREIVDHGPAAISDDAHDTHAAPPPGPPAGKPMDVQGQVVLPLFGPKGELRGALLDDGTSLRMPPHAAAELRHYLTPGVHVQAWGNGAKNKWGRTVEVDEIAELVDVYAAVAQ